MSIAFPRLRLDPSGIVVLNLHPAQVAIRRKYGPRYFVNNECLRELAGLWGIEEHHECINDVGVFIPYNKIEHCAGRCSAEIRFARSPSGLWAMDTSHSTATAGQGSSPSVSNPVAFLCENDARAEGLHRLIGVFRGIADGGGSDAADARKLVTMLQDERMPQLSLF